MKTNEMIAKAQFECYQKFLQVPVHENTGSYCNRTWDGWLCWDDTPAGKTAEQNCPPYFQDFDYSEIAFKVCEENGHWFVHPESKRVWTNYSLCSGNNQDNKAVWNLYYIAIIGLSLSLVSLLISLGIVLYFKSLSCPRVSLHKNLFFSFICKCVVSLTTLEGIVQQQPLVTTPPVCTVLHISQVYFFLCNFFWMLCEGIYLYIVTVVNVFAKRQALRWYYFLGWGFPLIPASIYAVARSMYFNDNCWYRADTLLFYIFAGPIFTVLLVNLLILIRIIYIVIKKLRARHLKKSIQYLKAVRATFILVPLLGIQILLASYEPSGRTSKEIHKYVLHIFIYYQVSSLLKYMQFTRIAKECCRVCYCQ
ncbi:calcitonin gene-related peptide type 1 receptor-like isoform X2 [Crotalus tigris]|uniref:calcitonin gene-related peptide type 1 receptor-like isoform X2 n=1 Tax=Crotalus tigris TaxID=88082 RepID=UPI00192F72CA|nr:calcitonin gene-related peptide type 1 receptor-like isoform X2 [Crotalus tigris]